MNWEIPEVQVGFRDGRWIRVQVANIHWIKAREFQKNTNIPEKHQTHESCLDKEIKPINLKENQPWKFIGRTIARLESFVDKNLCFVNYAKAFDCVDHNKLWKILREMDIPYSWETDFQNWERNMLRLYIFTHFFNLYAEYIMWNAGLHESQAEIKIAGRNINNFRYADDTTLMAESEEELKSFLMKVKEESENADLKLNIQKTKIMASSPITSWWIDGEHVETVSYFIFLGSKINVDGDCSH